MFVQYFLGQKDKHLSDVLDWFLEKQITPCFQNPNLFQNWKNINGYWTQERHKVNVFVVPQRSCGLRSAGVLVLPEWADFSPSPEHNTKQTASKEEYNFQDNL